MYSVLSVASAVRSAATSTKRTRGPIRSMAFLLIHGFQRTIGSSAEIGALWICLLA